MPGCCERERVLEFKVTLLLYGQPNWLSVLRENYIKQTKVWVRMLNRNYTLQQKHCGWVMIYKLRFIELEM